MNFDLVIEYSIKAYKNRHLLAAKKREKDFNKKRVYNVIKKNGSVTTGEILSQLTKTDNLHNERIRELIEKNYNNGQINSNEKNNIIKEKIIKTIGIRTIENLVNELHKEGLLIRQKRRFQLVQNDDFSSPYISEEYGKLMTERILDLDLKRESSPTPIKELINRFGLIVVYNFIIAYQEIKNKTDQKITNIYENYDEISWLEDVISVSDMYTKFIKIIEQYEIQNKYEGDILITKKLLNIIKSEYPSISSTLDEVKNHFIKQE